MNTEIGKQRVVGWVLGKYCAKDLRYVLLDGHDAEVIRHDSVVSELNNQLEAQAAYSSMQFDRIAELTAEVERYKDALHRVDQRCIDERNGSAFDAMYGMQEIARNALKEGV